MGKIIREFERRIVKMVIEKLLADGLELFIDHDDYEKIPITDAGEKTLDEMFACDEERLYVEHPPGGWVCFIYGNDGWDVISDYTVNLEDHLKEINAYCDQYS